MYTWSIYLHAYIVYIFPARVSEKLEQKRNHVPFCLGKVYILHIQTCIYLHTYTCNAYMHMNILIHTHMHVHSLYHILHQLSFWDGNSSSIFVLGFIFVSTKFLSAVKLHFINILEWGKPTQDGKANLTRLKSLCSLGFGSCWFLSLFPSSVDHESGLGVEQTKQLRLEVLQGIQHRGGLSPQISAQVSVWNHDHLHPGCQGDLHLVESIFKDKALLHRRTGREPLGIS